MATLAQIEERLNLLERRMARIATVEQVDTLQASVDTFKNQADADLSNLNQLYQQLQNEVTDLKRRVDALETA